MKHVKLFENFGEENIVAIPNLVTVELSDVWKDSKNLYKMPNTVELFNNNEIYSYIGNTRLDGFSGVIYFASRKDNLIFITGLDLEGAERNYDIDSLTSPYTKSKNQLDNSGLRKFQQGTCTLGMLNNADYSGDLEVGMTDNRGYFKIIEIK
jgi:hypothetical protein